MTVKRVSHVIELDLEHAIARAAAVVDELLGRDDVTPLTRRRLLTVLTALDRAGVATGPPTRLRMEPRRAVRVIENLQQARSEEAEMGRYFVTDYTDVGGFDVVATGTDADIVELIREMRPGQDLWRGVRLDPSVGVEPFTPALDMGPGWRRDANGMPFYSSDWLTDG